MATRTAVNPKWMRSATRNVMALEPCLVDGSATWKAGEFLRAKADGLVYEAASGDGESNTPFQYLAIQDHDTAFSADTSRLSMARIHEDDIFEINAYSASDSTIAETDTSISYGLYVSSNVCYLNLDDTGTSNSRATTALTVVEPAWRESEYQDDSADTVARVLVSVHNCEALPV